MRLDAAEEGLDIAKDGLNEDQVKGLEKFRDKITTHPALVRAYPAVQAVLTAINYLFSYLHNSHQSFTSSLAHRVCMYITE